MPAKTTRGFRIAFVQEAAHVTAILTSAVGSCTLEDVNTALINIFNTRHAIEEHVDWRDPVFANTF
jgi:hypothetical protein